MKLIRRLFFVIMLSLVGAVLGAAVAARVLEPSWDALGTPPRPATALLATSPQLIVEVSGGDMYSNCGVDCWAPFEGGGMQPPPEWIEIDCAHAEPPDLDRLVDLQVECEFAGVAVTYRAYAIDSTGTVFQWERFSAEWTWAEPILYGGVTGVVVLSIGMATIASLAFSDFLSFLRRRSQQEERNKEQTNSPDLE